MAEMSSARYAAASASGTASALATPLPAAALVARISFFNRPITSSTLRGDTRSMPISKV
jgi:hypothetical protein